MYIPQLKNKGQVTVSVCVHAWACKISTNVAATKSRRTRKGHIRDSRVMSSVATWYNFVNGENLSVMLQFQLLLVYVTVAFLTHNVHQTAEIILPNFMENSVRFQAWITGCGISAYECLMGAKATWPPGWFAGWVCPVPCGDLASLVPICSMSLVSPHHCDDRSDHTASEMLPQCPK